MRFFLLATLTVASLFVAPRAQADLTPNINIRPCYDKKAGDACEWNTLDESGFHYAPGKCVEANLEGLPLKRKAHLLCEKLPEPAASASAAPSAAPAPTPSAAPSPPVSAAVAPSAAPEPQRPPSSGCSVATERSASSSIFVALFVALFLLRRSRGGRS